MKTYIAILRETGDGEKAGNERREKFESDDLENESPEDFTTNVLCGDNEYVEDVLEVDPETLEVLGG